MARGKEVLQPPRTHATQPPSPGVSLWRTNTPTIVYTHHLIAALSATPQGPMRSVMLAAAVLKSDHIFLGI